MSQSMLETLPKELWLQILPLISCKDQANLARTSKDLQTLAQPFVWRRIDLFPPGVRESYRNTTIPWEPDSLHGDPGYCDGPIKLPGGEPKIQHHRSKSVYDDIPRAMFCNLACRLQSKGSRFERLCEQTRSLSTTLCFTIESNGNDTNMTFWTVITHFSNLEHLELTVDWDCVATLSPQESSIPRFMKIKSIKLWGYVPKAFMTSILLSAPTLETINLGLLDAHSETVWSDDDWRTGCKDLGPRPLIWLPDVIPPLPRLTHLYLCRPTESHPHEHTWDDLHYDEEADERCIRDWSRLITSTCSTLQHMVFDQRPCAPDDVLQDGLGGCKSFILEYDQPGSYRLAKKLMSLLDEHEFPCLIRIDFAGIFMEGHRRSDRRTRKKLSKACKAKDITYQFTRSPWCRHESGRVYFADGMGRAFVNEDGEPEEDSYCDDPEGYATDESEFASDSTPEGTIRQFVQDSAPSQRYVGKQNDDFMYYPEN